jgi:hypothetical protein
MKDIRFYLEYSTKADRRQATRKALGNHDGNVFAARADCGSFLSDGEACIEGLGAVYYRPNSPVASTSASLDHLSTRCLRISEAQAREIHPELFKRLDETED